MSGEGRRWRWKKNSVKLGTKAEWRAGMVRESTVITEGRTGSFRSIPGPRPRRWRRSCTSAAASSPGTTVERAATENKTKKNKKKERRHFHFFSDVETGGPPRRKSCRRRRRHFRPRCPAKRRRRRPVRWRPCSSSRPSSRSSAAGAWSNPARTSAANFEKMVLKKWLDRQIQLRTRFEIEVLLKRKRKLDRKQLEFLEAQQLKKSSPTPKEAILLAERELREWRGIERPIDDVAQWGIKLHFE